MVRLCIFRPGGISTTPPPFAHRWTQNATRMPLTYTTIHSASTFQRCLQPLLRGCVGERADRPVLLLRPRGQGGQLEVACRSPAAAGLRLANLGRKAAMYARTGRYRPVPTYPPECQNISLRARSSATGMCTQQRAQLTRTGSSSLVNDRTQQHVHRRMFHSFHWRHLLSRKAPSSKVKALQAMFLITDSSRSERPRHIYVCLLRRDVYAAALAPTARRYAGRVRNCGRPSVLIT